MMRTAFSRFWPSAVLGLAIAMAAPAALAAPSNEWTVDLQGRASVAGEVVLSLTPADGKATRVTIPVPAATNHEAAAVMVSNVMNERLGSATYHVAIDGIDDVKVTSVDASRTFELAIERNTAEGLKVEIDRD